jgi:hypothetical protein
MRSQRNPVDAVAIGFRPAMLRRGIRELSGNICARPWSFADLRLVSGRLQEETMKLNTKRCQVCEREMSLHALDPLEGEAHGVRMQIEGLPVMECAEGHKRFVVPDFADRLIEALFRDDSLVRVDPALQKGLLRKRYCCPGCGRKLDGGRNTRVEAKRVLELTGCAAFGVCVELPKFRCSACGMEYVPPGAVVVDDLMEASAHAFRSAAVAPT